MAEANLQGPRADAGTRFVAALIDGVILVVINVVLQLILKTVGSALALLINIGYFSYFDGGPTGQTIGKRVMGIRVIDFQTGGPIGFGRGFLRWIGRFISAIPCGLGYLWLLWDPQKQGWHDKIATTVVVPVSSYPITSG